MESECAISKQLQVSALVIIIISMLTQDTKVEALFSDSGINETVSTRVFLMSPPTHSPTVQAVSTMSLHTTISSSAVMNVTLDPTPLATASPIANISSSIYSPSPTDQVTPSAASIVPTAVPTVDATPHSNASQVSSTGYSSSLADHATSTIQVRTSKEPVPVLKTHPKQTTPIAQPASTVSQRFQTSSYLNTATKSTYTRETPTPPDMQHHPPYLPIIFGLTVVIAVLLLVIFILILTLAVTSVRSRTLKKHATRITAPRDYEIPVISNFAAGSERTLETPDLMKKSESDLDMSINDAYGELQPDPTFLSPLHNTIYDTISDIDVDMLEVENDDEVQITINLSSSKDRLRHASTRTYEEVDIFNS